MALITCPECGREVSSISKICPNCGYPISEATNDVIRIKIDQHPQILGSWVRICNADTQEVIAEVRSGSVAEIKSSKDLRIYFTDSLVSSKPNLLTATMTVSPKNGGKYRATWGMGFFSASINSCTKVDVIDS